MLKIPRVWHARNRDLSSREARQIGYVGYAWSTYKINVVPDAHVVEVIEER